MTLYIKVVALWEQSVGGITFFSSFSSNHSFCKFPQFLQFPAIFAISCNFCMLTQFHRIKLHKYPAYSIAFFKKMCWIIKDFCPQQSQKRKDWLTVQLKGVTRNRVRERGSDTQQRDPGRESNRGTFLHFWLCLLKLSSWSDSRIRYRSVVSSLWVHPVALIFLQESTIPGSTQPIKAKGNVWEVPIILVLAAVLGSAHPPCRRSACSTWSDMFKLELKV